MCMYMYTERDSRDVVQEERAPGTMKKNEWKCDVNTFCIWCGGLFYRDTKYIWKVSKFVEFLTNKLKIGMNCISKIRQRRQGSNPLNEIFILNFWYCVVSCGPLLSIHITYIRFPFHKSIFNDIIYNIYIYVVYRW